MLHLSNRELALLGEPTKEQALALVGWMVLANAFGAVSEPGFDWREELPSRTASRWVGLLSRSAGVRGQQTVKRAAKPNVAANRRRRVRARYQPGQLATGKH